MVRWLFFDVGNVLVIDELYTVALWSTLLDSSRQRGLDTTIQTLMAERERLVIEEVDPVPFDTQGQRLLGAAGWQETKSRVNARFRNSWMEFNVPVPGWSAYLNGLKAQFRLAIAANQPRTCRDHLRHLEILDCFDLVGISEDHGISKPDQRFFLELLAEAECDADKAVMIGDRIDNDIAPAQRLGFRTIQVCYEPAGWWFPEATEVSEAYLASLRVAPARGCGPENIGMKADAIVRSVDQLVPALDQFSP